MKGRRKLVPPQRAGAPLHRPSATGSVGGGKADPAADPAADRARAATASMMARREQSTQQLASAAAASGRTSAGNRTTARLLAPESKTDGRVRPRLPEVEVLEDAGADPVADSPPAVQEQWEQLDHELRVLRMAIFVAQNTVGAWSATRAAWYEEAEALDAQLAQMRSDAVIEQTRASYEELTDRIYDVSIAANQDWVLLRDRVADAMARSLTEGTVAGVYAYEYLVEDYRPIAHRVAIIGEVVLVKDDFAELARALDLKEHGWRGELKAARERYEQVAEMLSVVAELKEDRKRPDELLPGWTELADSEQQRLDGRAVGAPTPALRASFAALAERLRQARDRADTAHPPTTNIFEKGALLVKGAVGALVNPLVEAGKQAVDVTKILAFTAYRFFGGESWEPELISDMAAHAKESGAGTWDLVVGMGESIIRTPERMYDAIRNDDWEAIGAEAANLYMLASAAKSAAGAAKRIPEMYRAAASRAVTVLRFLRSRLLVTGKFGGMTRAAMRAFQRIADTHGLEIFVRPVERAVVRLRELGHPGKLEKMKMKTIKDVDVHLGADPADIGKVGFFEPELPANYLRLRNAHEVLARYEQRMAEWNSPSNRQAVASLEAEGAARLEGKVLVDPKTGKAFTGDYDLFEIRANGKTVRFDELESAIREALEAEPIAVRHPEHLSWDDIPLSDLDVFVKIVKSHRPRYTPPGATAPVGGEPLLRFAPEKPVEMVPFAD